MIRGTGVAHPGGGVAMNESAGGVLRQIRSLFALGAAGGLPDAELLRRFAGRRDEAGDAAFEALVQRHGPMVRGVCRRMLRDPHDAEDAFQATFLVLVRRAGSIARPDSLGNWLYGVAVRTSRAARARALRRRAREGASLGITVADPAPDGLPPDLRPLLDEELNRLPAAYRAPVVLCDLEGKSRKDAARELGCAEGTLSSRLARARGLLRDRLLRRGVALGAGAVAGSSSGAATAAAVPAAWVRAVAAGAVPASAAELAGEVLRGMVMIKMRFAAAVFLAAIVGPGVGLLMLRGVGGDRAGAQEGGGAAGAVAKVDPGARDLETLQGTWGIDSWTEDGILWPEKDTKAFRMTIKGDGWSVDLGGKVYAGTIKLDGSTSPKHEDSTVAEGAEKRERNSGIYAVDGDTFIDCWAEDGNSRPAAFRSAVGSQHTLVIWRRVKP